MDGSSKRWRTIGWAGAAALLAMPFLAMQVMGDPRSAAAEFLVIVAVLASAGLAIAASVTERDK